MIDSMGLIVTIEFLVLIVVVAGMIFWFDRKQNERLDRIQAEMREIQAEMRDTRVEMRAEMRDTRVEMRAEMREMRAEMQGIQRDLQMVNSKVDRAQGALDVLVFGERGVPPPVASERAEMERRAEEAIGD